MADTIVESLPFAEAINYFKQKVRLPTQHWTDQWQDMHARAFVVAGATKDALLEDFQNSITKALEEGTTLAEFRKDFDQIVARHGWSYRGNRGWRSRVIYDQPICGRPIRPGAGSKSSGFKARRPYLRYVAVLDARTRPDHRTWHGVVLHADDPFWHSHYPPNGWLCRCIIQTLSQRDMDRFGYELSEGPPPSREIKHRINTPGGPRTVTAPEGIDPGFAHNPGRAATGTRIDADAMASWRKKGAKAWERLTPGDWRSAGRPEIIPVDKPVAKLGPAASQQDKIDFRHREDDRRAEKVFTLKDGSPLVVTAEALGDHLALSRAPLCL